MHPPALLSAAGFILIAVLFARRIPGAIIIAILLVIYIGIALGVTPSGGIISMLPSLAPTFMQMDIVGALNIRLISIIFAFWFVDLFDTAGTLVGLAHRGNLLDTNEKLPRLRRALLADSSATVVGAALGTSTTTSYIESVSGINAGGRTGLTAVVIALLFLISLFLSPLAATIPAYATAPALLFVACVMTRGLSEIDWEDVTEVVPAVITAISMPLTFSIATGLGLGFISYAAIKLFSGRTREVPIAVYVIAAAFILKFSLV